MKRLRIFNSEQEYNAVKDSLKYPSLACIKGSSTELKLNSLNSNKQYLSFTALENGTFTLTIPAEINTDYMTSISYSVNGGDTWITTNIDDTIQTITTPEIRKGSRVMWKGIGTQVGLTYSAFSNFSSTGYFNIVGNIMSLLYGDNFENQTTLPSGSSYNFEGLFLGCSKLINAEKCILAPAALTEYCYQQMFKNCTSMQFGPQLPAMELAACCYSEMFMTCSSLKIAPQLPATTLTQSCYGSMFYECTSLTKTPELNATTFVGNNCYQYMFFGCTRLIEACDLPATTIKPFMYQYMFYNCSNLVKIPEILPATTLTQRCYYYMFRGCSKITKAPVLPATTLVTQCYVGMFYACSKLNYVKALFTTTPGSYTTNWVNGVASSGTFVKNSAATWTTTGTGGVPTGWTVQTASA